MKRNRWIGALIAVVGVGAGSGSAAFVEPRPGDSGAGVTESAGPLPVLDRKDGTVRIPAAVEGAIAWRPVREGVQLARVEEQDVAGVRVSYARTKQKPAGVAMLLAPGTLTGVDRFEFILKGTGAQRLSLSLRDEDGVVWSLPSVRVPGEEASRVSLELARIEPDPYQNKGTVTSAFDASRVVMITVLDIGGYFSAAEPQCEWTIADVKGVVR